MQTTAIRTVAYSLPENEAILLTLLISNRYILFAELANIFVSPYFLSADGRICVTGICFYVWNRLSLARIVSGVSGN